MKKFFFVKILLLFLLINSKAQTKDTAYHYIGIGIGSLNEYGIILPILEYKPAYFTQFQEGYNKFELNFNYSYSKNSFYFKLENGMVFDSKYGTILRFYPTIGFNTSMKKMVAMHSGFGLGSIFGTESNGYSKLFNVGPIFNTGLIISPFKSKKYTISIDASTVRYKIITQWPYNGPLTGQRSIDKAALLFYNLSFCYRLQKKTNFK